MGATRTAILAGLATAYLLLAALSASPAGASSGAATVGEVKVDVGPGNKFSPADLTVAPGTTIVFENKDASPHTVTAFDGKIPAGATYFDSSGGANETAAKAAPVEKWMKQGDKFSITLTVEGVYEYYCVPHGLAMVGKITVKAGAGGGGGGGGLTVPGFEIVSVLIAGASAAVLFGAMVRRRQTLAAAGQEKRGFDIYEAGILTCVVFCVGTLAWMAATAAEIPPAGQMEAHGYQQGRYAAVTILAFIALLLVPAVWFVLGPSSTSPIDEEETAEAASSA